MLHRKTIIKVHFFEIGNYEREPLKMIKKKCLIVHSLENNLRSNFIRNMILGKEFKKKGICRPFYYMIFMIYIPFIIYIPFSILFSGQSIP